MRHKGGAGEAGGGELAQCCQALPYKIDLGVGGGGGSHSAAKQPPSQTDAACHANPVGHPSRPSSLPPHAPAAAGSATRPPWTRRPAAAAEPWLAGCAPPPPPRPAAAAAATRPARRHARRCGPPRTGVARRGPRRGRRVSPGSGRSGLQTRRLDRPAAPGGPLGRRAAPAPPDREPSGARRARAGAGAATPSHWPPPARAASRPAPCRPVDPRWPRRESSGPAGWPQTECAAA
eukprot:scaffold13524_cov109-Isochrysis_galbana.AAC.5